MTKYIRTLTVLTDAEIQQKEVPLFRGAVLNCLGDKANILFHNHLEENKYRYSYPLIQYKRIHGKAAIVCIGDGVPAIHEFFISNNFLFHLGKKEVEIKLDYVKIYDNEVCLCDSTQHYRIHNWLPLNSDNYAKYQATDNLIEKIQMLERVLLGNILSFLKGVGIHLEEQLELHITSVMDQRPIIYKKVKLMAFDIEFKANIQMPQYIGVGKNASAGYGTLTKITN